MHPAISFSPAAVALISCAVRAVSPVSEMLSKAISVRPFQCRIKLMGLNQPLYGAQWYSTGDKPEQLNTARADNNRKQT